MQLFQCLVALSEQCLDFVMEIVEELLNISMFLSAGKLWFVWAIRALSADAMMEVVAILSSVAQRFS